MYVAYVPSTENISVFVKCLYSDSFTKFLLKRRVRVVCTRLVNT